MSSEGQQQQQQQQQQQPAFDMGVVFGSLSDDNKIFAEKKGWSKDGKPVEGFNFNAAFDSYRGAEKLIGAKTLAAPVLESDEEFSKWEGHKLLGRVEKPEDYKFDKPALPDGLKWGTGEGEVPWDDAGEKMLRVALAKGIIGQKQANAVFAEIVNARMGEVVQSMAARKQETETITANLTRDYGAGLKGALQSANMAFKHLADLAKVDIGPAIDGLAAVIGNEQTTRLGIQLAKMLGEDKLEGGAAAGFATSPIAAQAKIDAFKADPAKVKALSDKTNPGHAAAKTEWENLWKQVPQ